MTGPPDRGLLISGPTVRNAAIEDDRPCTEKLKVNHVAVYFLQHNIDRERVNTAADV
jgi:hypothetical protein